ncbi:hypothetical protein ABZX93_14060 [Streptomyces sp. NPDC006632]|uniref:hypothetical protein n=1 Tax=Streptomyces sp. NPDC006632 TaxID=3157182 RepID=UPI0033B4735A
MENRPSPQPSEGCLTVVVRVPVRIVVFVLVVPVRMVWDLLVAGAKVLRRRVFTPLWRVLVVIPSGWSYRVVLTPAGHAIAWLGRVVGAGLGAVGRGLAAAGAWGVRVLLVAPSVWVYRVVLAPAGRAVGWVLSGVWLGLAWVGRGVGRGLVRAGRGIGAGLARVGKGVGVGLVWGLRALFVWPWSALWRRVLAPVLRYGLVVPAAWLYRYVLIPVGHGTARLVTLAGSGLAALGVLLLVVPARWLYRAVLTPLGRGALVVVREIGVAIGFAWRAAGFVSRAVGRGLAWLVRNFVGLPVRWVYATLLTPVGHWVRDAVLRPARRALREAGRAARQALVSARETVRTARRDAWRALVGGPARELPEHRARTLGSTTTASGAVPAPEISLSKAEG